MSITLIQPATTQGSPYQLGAWIELYHFLALPGDGNRYSRDEQGRLELMGPDNLRTHRRPIAAMTRYLNRLLSDPQWVVQEVAVAFPRIYSLRGDLLPESFLGPKSIVPDIAVFAHAPRALVLPRGRELALPEGLRLVVEILSPGTWNADLGEGEADDVDRPRTYLENGVLEYWTLNVGVEHPTCPLAPRSGRFLERTEDGGAWRDLPVVEGRVRSRAVPEVDFDLEAFLLAVEERPPAKP